MSSDSEKLPRVIVFGGCGFIGRNLVEYLVSEGLVSAVRVVDKTPPQLAWLNKTHADIFNRDIVEFRSANLINPASCESAAEGDWDVGVNCAGETRPGLADAVYEQGVLALGTNVARVCCDKGLRLVEIGSAHVYPTDKSEHSEESACAGWTACGRYKLQLERELDKLAPRLRYTVLRVALAYGPGDIRSLMPRVVACSVYKELRERLRLLWSAELRLDTVHARDVCRAAWLVARRDDTLGRVYNVADDARSTQGSLTAVAADIFTIEYEYVGNALSLLAKSDLEGVAAEANDKHLSAWARACAAAGVTNTPLEPTASRDTFDNKHLAVDTAALRRLGFLCAVPAPTSHIIRQILEDYAEMKIFPKSLLL